MRSSSARSRSCSFSPLLSLSSSSPLRPPPPALLLSSLLLCTNITPVLGGAAGGDGVTLAVRVSNDFSSYPAGSQGCLNSSADSSGCTSAPSGPELNDCLCYNHGDFIYATARCVAAASPGDLGAVYAQMRENCRGTGDTISVAEDSFMSQAAQATASKSSAASVTGGPPTPSLPPPPLGDGDGDGGGTRDGATSLSMGAKIGIGAGIGFGVVVAALAAWFIWVYSHRQRLRTEEEGSSTNNGKHPDPDPHAEYAQQNRQDGGAAELPSSSSLLGGSSAGWWRSPNTAAAEMDADAYYANKHRWPRQASQASERESSVLAELPAATYTGSELPATTTYSGGSGVPAPRPQTVSPLSPTTSDQLPAAVLSSVGGGGGGGGGGKSAGGGVGGASGPNDGGDGGEDDDGIRCGNHVIRSQVIATNSLMSSSVGRERGENHSITSSSDTWSAWPSHDDTATINSPTALGPAPAGLASPTNPPPGSRHGSSIHTQHLPPSRGSQLSS